MRLYKKFEIVDQKEIWIATAGKGLLRIDFSGNIIEGPVRELQWTDNSTIDLSTVYEITQTNEGLVWLGVEGVGALMLQPNAPFSTITKNDPYFPGIQHPFCTNITALQHNRLLVKTFPEELLMLDLETKQATTVQIPMEMGNRLYAVHGWEEGALISGENGLWSVQDLYSVGSTSELVLKDEIKFISKKDESFFLCGPNGIYEWKSRQNEPAKIASNFVHYMVHNDDRGCYVLDEHNVKFLNDSFEVLISKDFERYKVKSLLYDERLGLWAATENGVIQLHEETLEIIHHHTIETGLPDNFVYGLLAYGKSIWGSTNRGIFRLNLATHEIVSFSKKDGLQSNEFNSGAFATTNHGLFVFGGINGLSIFDPADFYHSGLCSPHRGLAHWRKSVTYASD